MGRRVAGGVRIDWRAVRDGIDLAAVATGLLGPAPGRRGERSSRKLWWHCPLHEDPNPSFCVEVGKCWWRCYGCGERGDAATLVMKLQGRTFREAAVYLAGGAVPSGKAGPVPSPGPKPVPKATARGEGMAPAAAKALVDEAAARLWRPEGAEALAYLTGPRRVLTPEAIRAARLGWTPRAKGTPWTPPGVVIPWFTGPRLALVKLRVPDAWRRRFPEARRPPKYIEAHRDPARLTGIYPGPEAIHPGRPLVVAEGEFDALLLGQELEGLAAVVTLGSASGRPDPDILGSFLSAAPWLVATDADEAGELAAAAWPPPARRIRPPGSFNDWTEIKAAGVDLRRWWGDVLAGGDRPALFTWGELAGRRWGPARDDPTPGIIID